MLHLFIYLMGFKCIFMYLKLYSTSLSFHLRDKDFSFALLYLNAKEVFHQSEIVHVEFPFHALHKFLNNLHVCASVDKVIDIETNISH